MTMRAMLPIAHRTAGSTLLGGAEIVRRHAGADTSVAAFVTHLVAKYDRTVLDKFVAKLYGEVRRFRLEPTWRLGCDGHPGWPPKPIGGRALKPHHAE